jgi:zinc D-Ala-D-Ala dipeptidase
MTPTLQCIEDVKSAWYNQIVDRASVTPDWSSTDLLRRKDGLYEIIAFVEHNTAPAIAGRGSCILLHVWTSETTPTAGCTSMARDALFSVVAGLIDERSVLVQLPEPEYEELRVEWGLP